MSCVHLIIYTIALLFIGYYIGYQIAMYRNNGEVKLGVGFPNKDEAVNIADQLKGKFTS